MCILNLTERISGHGYYTQSNMYAIKSRAFPSLTAGDASEDFSNKRLT